MVRPDAPNVQRPVSVISPVVASVIDSRCGSVAPMRTVTVSPTASFICEASVRLQISSYSRKASPLNPVSAGAAKCSPAGRIASCASCAFFTFEV